MSVPSLTAVFSSDALGGSELFNLEFLRIAHRRGVAIHALVPGDGPVGGALAPLVDTMSVVPVPRRLTAMSRFESRVELRELPRRLSALGAYLPSLGRSIAKLPGPVCSLGFRSQLAVAAVLPPRRPGVWVVHEVVPPGAPASVWRAASRRAAQILTYSNAAASQRALRGRGASVRGVCFDLSHYGRIAPAEHVRTLGLVGDLVELKNHLLAIDLTRRLRDRGREVSVLLVGRDVSGSVPRAAEYAGRVRSEVAAAPDAELVSSTPEEMPQVMAGMDVLLHLTSVPESFGRVCVEAMAAGRPVIAYDHGAVSELIEDGRTGFLCPAGDSDAVERALLKLIEDPRLCADMASAARSSALERFGAQPARRDTVGDALADFAIANDD
jgi:glycosyltransferase involved in cell wall biosynthesis